MNTKKLLFILLLLIGGNSIFGQPAISEKFSISLDLGKGYLFGKSNLSPYGINYRGEYKNGFTGNIRGSYLLNRTYQVGIKYNFFTTSENYVLDKGEQVADDVTLQYIAPQMGFRKMVTDRLCLNYMYGGGYMHYRSKGLCNSVEHKYRKGFIGANADMAFTYRLFKNQYIGINTSIMGGRTKSFKETVEQTTQTVDLNKWDRIKILRADVTVSFMCLL